MKLHELKPIFGSKRKKKRLGRGHGSGHGDTSTRGHKGQKARSGGKVGIAFEGGQMPLVRRVPKRGFHNIFKKKYALLNIDNFLDVPENIVVDEKYLKENGYIKKVHDGIKLLGRGEIKKPLTFRIHKISNSAKIKVEKAGGKIEIVGS